MLRAGLLLALGVAACASGQGAPISYGSGAARPVEAPQRQERRARAPVVYARREPAAEEAAPTPARTPAVQEQPSWADGAGTPLSTYALQPDEAQPFDPAHLPRSHRVGADESLYDIATRYQVPLRALIDQNRLEPPYALTPGSEIALPPPRFHTVARGETLEDMARDYNVDLRSLALLNRMQAPYAVRQGDRIVLPAMAREASIEAPAQPRVVEPPRADPAAPIVAGNGHFAWPLRGEVLARFGTQPGGVRVDGLEIGGRVGAPIVAAGDGEVVYAGTDLPAYGTLVLVRHADDYVTAYGYARRALVREGQRVHAGEPIAELGPRSDGSARLLFQVRRGSSAVDPLPLLGPPAR